MERYKYNDSSGSREQRKHYTWKNEGGILRECILPSGGERPTTCVRNGTDMGEYALIFAALYL
jgi:hypothetical protein